MRHRVCQSLTIAEPNKPTNNSVTADVTLETKKSNKERTTSFVHATRLVSATLLLIRYTLQASVTHKKLQLTCEEQPSTASNLNKSKLHAKIPSLVRAKPKTTAITTDNSLDIVRASCTFSQSVTQLIEIIAFILMKTSVTVVTQIGVVGCKPTKRVPRSTTHIGKMLSPSTFIRQPRMDRICPTSA